MRIVIPSNLTELEIIKQLSDMVREYSKLNMSYQDTSLEKYLSDKAYDYVKEFISMTDDSLDDNTINYLISCFYKSKGTLEIFNMMKKYLNVKFKSEPIYTIDNLYLDIEEVDTIDMTRYLSSMKNFLMSLLYYKDLSVLVDKIKLYIKDKILISSSSYVELYKEFSFNYNNRDTDKV